MDNPSDVIDRLSQRLEVLEQRVSLLEHPSEPHPDLSAPSRSNLADTAANPSLRLVASKTAAEAPSIPPGVPGGQSLHAGVEPVSSPFTALGKTVLGIAGAYLLRALAESGSFPWPVIVALAITYAGVWLAAAARARAKEVFTRFVYALTSAVILAPMLWELTLRFKVLSPSASAAILTAFAVAALVLTWKNNNQEVFWIGYSTAIVAAVALMIAAQSLPPFLCALLVIALGAEFASYRGHVIEGRILGAVAVDIATILLLYIYSLDQSSRSGYGNFAPLVLMALASIPLFHFLTSITLRAALRERRLSAFDVIRGTLAFLFAAYGAMRFGADPYRVETGITCIVLTAALYAIGFVFFRRSSASRNFGVYTTWGMAAFALGTFLLLPHPWLAGITALAAIVSTATGIRRAHLVLVFHGALYLVSAAYFSNLLQFDHQLLVASQLSSPSWVMGLIFICSFLCYGVTKGDPLDTAYAQLPRLAMAATAATSTAAFAVYLLERIAARIYPQTSFSSMNPITFLQTLCLCAIGLGLAAGGSRLRRQELIWLAYTTVLGAAAKVLLYDMRHETLLAIAATFFFLAATLILIPHVMIPEESAASTS